jgi:hypothetical protein
VVERGCSGIEAREHLEPEYLLLLLGVRLGDVVLPQVQPLPQQTRTEKGRANYSFDDRRFLEGLGDNQCGIPA